jgi:hypothetical protein
LEILAFTASSRVNLRMAHLFMICSNIKLTGPAESIGIDAMTIHEWNQRDSTMNVQRKLEILADANPARGIRASLPASNAKHLRKGAIATKQSMPQRVERWIASAFAKASADKSLRSQ